MPVRLFMKWLLIAVLCAVPAAGLRAAELTYTKKLDRLAEILGSLHYLRNLCGEKGDSWRQEMEKLIAAEKPDSARRAELIATFNRGYRTFDSVYSSCTPAAIEAINLYMKEGKSLSEGIVVQFGN